MPENSNNILERQKQTIYNQCHESIDDFENEIKALTEKTSDDKFFNLSENDKKITQNMYISDDELYSRCESLAKPYQNKLEELFKQHKKTMQRNEKIQNNVVKKIFTAHENLKSIKEKTHIFLCKKTRFQRRDGVDLINDFLAWN